MGPSNRITSAGERVNSRFMGIDYHDTSLAEMYLETRYKKETS